MKFIAQNTCIIYLCQSQTFKIMFVASFMGNGVSLMSWDFVAFVDNPALSDTNAANE